MEGANILTRNLIIFGQGAIRCHPYVLTELQAAASDDPAQGLRDFDEAFFAHVGFTLSNAVRSLVMALTGARLEPTPSTDATAGYFRQLTRLSAAFAFTTDVAMLTLGGTLKRRERISARMADALSHLYMASAVLKRFEDTGRPEEDMPLVDWAVKDSLRTIEESLAGVIRNFPNRVVGALLRLIVVPLGVRNRGPDDRLGHRVAGILMEPSASRDRLTEGVYLNRDADDPIGLMELTLEAVLAAEPLEARLREATGVRLAPHNVDEALAAGVEEGVLTELEEKTIRKAMSLTEAAISVDRSGEIRQTRTSPAEVIEHG